MNLLSLIEKLEGFRKENFLNSNFNWTDYEFGKNFCENVIRNDEQTKLETDFIIEKLRIKNNSKIIDIGCGSGRNAIPLAKKGYEVLGLDLNKYSIDLAKKETKNINNITFINQDILSFNSNEKFDIAMLIFMHFSNFNKIEIRNILKNIANLLVHKGKLLIEILSIDYARSLNNYQEWNILDKSIAGSFKQLSLSEYKFIDKKNVLIRNDFFINISNLELSRYSQLSYVYEIDELSDLFKSFSLKVKSCYGDWSGKLFSEDDETLILLAEKLI